MSNDNFINKMRWFFGLSPQPPRNDFRNPIWGSDDEDDDDELYSRQAMDTPDDFMRHMHDVTTMMRSFGGFFGDMKSFFHDDKSFFEHDNFDYDYAGSVPEHAPDSDKLSSNSIRDYYLKPGYKKHSIEQKDQDLDGKISSGDVSRLLQEGNEDSPGIVKQFNGDGFAGRSFCRTIITTSIRKPDGTVETRRIVKKGNETIEDSTTSSEPESRGPHSPGLNTVSTTGIMLSELMSSFKNLY